MFLKYTLFAVLLYVVWKGLLKIWSVYFEQTISTSGRGVFITGCDTGKDDLYMIYKYAFDIT